MSKYYDYIIIGAGIAGIQLSYFFKKSGKNYIALTSKNGSASLFIERKKKDRFIITLKYGNKVMALN